MSVNFNPQVSASSQSLPIQPLERQETALDLTSVQTPQNPEIQATAEATAREIEQQKNPIKLLQLDLMPILDGFKPYSENIIKVLATNILPMISELMQTKKRQTMTFIFPGDQKIFKFKVRFVGNEFQVLFGQGLGMWNSKFVYKMALLAGPRLPNQPPGKIFTYGKIQDLVRTSSQCRHIQERIEQARSSHCPQEEICELESMLQSTVAEYEAVNKRLAEEAKLTQIVPDAVKMWTVPKYKDPSHVKGVIMEYVNDVLDESFFPSDPPKLDAESFKRNIDIALALCQAVDRMHKVGVAHLNLNLMGILGENNQGSIAIKLVNFYNAAQKVTPSEGGCGRDYQKLSDRSFLKCDTFQDCTAQDMSQVGYVLTSLFYGTLKKCFVENDLKRLKYDSDPCTPPSFEAIKNAVKPNLGTYPKIDELLYHLFDQNPSSRFTAEQAALRLQKIPTEMENPSMCSIM